MTQEINTLAKRNNERHQFMIKVTGVLAVLTSLKDDFQEVLRKQKIEKIMLFGDETDNYYIRL